MIFEIRVATPHDALAACAVLRRSISECCIADHGNDRAILDAWLGNKTPQMVAHWFASPANFSLVALKAGEILGVALLTRAGKLALCYLLPGARRRGIGKALLARLEMQARDWDVKTIQVCSTASGAEFYASQGYIRSGHVPAPYGIQAVFFWKRLDADSSFDPKRCCNCNTA